MYFIIQNHKPPLIMTCNFSQEKFTNFLETLIKRKQNFELVETKKKSYIVFNKTKFYNDPNKQDLTLSELGLISKTKKEIIKNLEKIDLPDHTRKDYFIGINKSYYYEHNIFEGIIKKPVLFNGEAVQIDIKSAYLTAVKNMGLLSIETYNKFFELEDRPAQLKKKQNNLSYKDKQGKILKYSKLSRLIAIGSLATDKKIMIYKEGILSETKREYNEKQANVFFTASAKIGELMINLIENCKGFFYWVDAVFLPKKEVVKAIDILKLNSYHYNIDTINLTQKGNLFESVNMETGEIKNYAVPSSKTINLLKEINKDSFIVDIIKQYKEISEIVKTDKQKETLRKALKSEIVNNYDLDSKIDIRFLSKNLSKFGLFLEDLIRIQVNITEIHKDKIFQNEIIQILIFDKLINLSEKYNIKIEEETENTIIQRDLEYKFI